MGAPSLGARVKFMVPAPQKMNNPAVTFFGGGVDCVQVDDVHPCLLANVRDGTLLSRLHWQRSNIISEIDMGMLKIKSYVDGQNPAPPKKPWKDDSLL